jgi:hypothetical protein
MSTDSGRTHSVVVMQIVGVVMIVAAAVWLFVADEPFPTWLIVAGGGVMFLGGSSASQNDGQSQGNVEQQVHSCHDQVGQPNVGAPSTAHVCCRCVRAM